MPRPKGSKNNVSQKARTTISRFIEKGFTANELDRLVQKIERDEGASKAFNCYVQLIDYVLPKLARVEHTGKDGDQLSVEHVLKTLQHSQTFQPLPEPDNSDILEADIITEQEKE